MNHPEYPTQAVSTGTVAVQGRTAPSTTKALLSCGVLAGPLFVAVAAAQVVSREHFDLREHPISLLSNGSLGWVQISNFVVAGVLMVAFAAGLRATLTQGRGSRWVPRTVALFGVGLVVSGVFVASPENGFPAGTPDGPPVTTTWRDIGHGIGVGLAFDALIVACILMSLRLRKAHRPAALACGAVALTLLVLPMPVSQEGLGIRLAVSALVAFGWTTAVATLLLRSFSSDPNHERSLR
ncbi:MAG: DUF998 domain-containing protein [Nocardioidaceae bacterium]